MANRATRRLAVESRSRLRDGFIAVSQRCSYRRYLRTQHALQFRHEVWHLRISLADSLLDLCGRGLNRSDADVARNPFESVGKPLGDFPVSVRKCLTDADIRVGLLRGELLQQAPVQALVAGDPFQST